MDTVVAYVYSMTPQFDNGQQYLNQSTHMLTNMILQVN